MKGVMEKNVTQKLEFYDEVEKEFRKITNGKYNQSINPDRYQKALKEFRDNIEYANNKKFAAKR